MSWCHEAGHGDKFIDHKCMYCCAVALYNCGGDNFFCSYHHHDGKGRPGYEEEKRGYGGDCKGDVSKCNLGIEHTPNLEYLGNIFPNVQKVGKPVRFSLGCSLCREQKENAKDLKTRLKLEM